MHWKLLKLISLYQILSLIPKIFTIYIKFIRKQHDLNAKFNEIQFEVQSYVLLISEWVSVKNEE